MFISLARLSIKRECKHSSYTLSSIPSVNLSVCLSAWKVILTAENPRGNRGNTRGNGEKICGITAVMGSVDAVIPWGWDGKHGNTVPAVDVPYCRC